MIVAVRSTITQKAHMTTAVVSLCGGGGTLSVLQSALVLTHVSAAAVAARVPAAAAAAPPPAALTVTAQPVIAAIWTVVSTALLIAVLKVA